MLSPVIRWSFATDESVRHGILLPHTYWKRNEARANCIVKVAVFRVDFTMPLQVRTAGYGDVAFPSCVKLIAKRARVEDAPVS